MFSFFRFYFILFSFFVFFNGILAETFCQAPGDTVNSTAERLGSDTKTENFVIINRIGIIGNKVTKDHIILRELTFSENDTVSSSVVQAKLRSSKENLLNTSLFNFVTIDTIPTNDERIEILISVAERWYTWPIPIFEIQERNFNTWWETRNFDRANYGFFLERENFRGRKEDLSFYFQFGYTEKYGITYRIPYLTRRQTSGAGITFSYSRNHEVAYASVDNKQLFFKDESGYVRQEFTGKLYYTYRSGIYNTHTIETKYVNSRINDTLFEYSSDYFLYKETAIEYVSLDYFFRSDHRNSRIFPLKGHYLELEATKLGFGLLSNEKIDVWNFFLTLKQYQKLSNRFYLAGGLRFKYSPTPNQPYYVQRGLGWGDYVRGYEYYVIDGQSYGTAKLGLKYEIIKPRIVKVPLPFNKFNTFHYALYAGIFGDAGYVDDNRYAQKNPLANSFLYGYGAGIDYVTYYDIVFRFEYSFNKMLEHGFFVSFNAGI